MRVVSGFCFFLFFPSFFWCGTLTIKHGEGVLTMVLWGECVCIPDVKKKKKKKARKKEKRRKEEQSQLCMV